MLAPRWAAASARVTAAWPPPTTSTLCGLGRRGQTVSARRPPSAPMTAPAARVSHLVADGPGMRGVCEVDAAGEHRLARWRESTSICAELYLRHAAAAPSVVGCPCLQEGRKC